MTKNRGDTYRGHVRWEGQRCAFSVGYKENGKPLYVMLDDEPWLDTDQGIARWGWEKLYQAIESGEHAA